MRKICGFTYVELIITGTIIVIMAVIAVPNFLEARTRATVSRSVAELAVLKMSLEEYQIENKAWPLNRDPGIPSPWDLTALTTPIAYLTQLPMDAMLAEQLPRDGHERYLPVVPYHYLNAVQVAPEKGLVIENSEESLGGGFVAGVLLGYGPAYYDFFDSPLKGFRSSFTPDATAQITLYNPTNGTVSSGDIAIRFP